jgi:hypothetical protein
MYKISLPYLSAKLSMKRSAGGYDRYHENQGEKIDNVIELLNLEVGNLFFNPHPYFLVIFS